MAGDVNVFVTPDDGNFELSVMIAEPKFRRGGLAYEAVQLMMAYVAQRLPPLNGRSFVAKIEADNKASIRLFEKLKFSPDSFSEVFNLFTYRLDVQFLENCNIETLTIEAYITDE
jgi:RimJ/RimL family protein N-acetyltransferase